MRDHLASNFTKALDGPGRDDRVETLEAILAGLREAVRDSTDRTASGSTAGSRMPRDRFGTDSLHTSGTYCTVFPPRSTPTLPNVSRGNTSRP